MFNITTVVFDGTSPPTFISQTLRDGTTQVQIDLTVKREYVVVQEVINSRN